MSLKKQVRKALFSVFCAGLLIGVCVGLRSTGLIVGGLVVGGLILAVSLVQLFNVLRGYDDEPESAKPRFQVGA